MKLKELLDGGRRCGACATRVVNRNVFGSRHVEYAGADVAGAREPAVGLGAHSVYFGARRSGHRGAPILQQ